MLTVSEKNRPYFMKTLQASNAVYSEEWKCPTMYLDNAKYHTQLHHCHVHSTREAFTYANALLLTAMGLFQSVVSAILLLSTNAIAKWINGEGIW